MAKLKELDNIKKMYGEEFMHLCRELFPTILEHKGILTKILTRLFSTNSKTLAEDIKNAGLEDDFRNIVFR